jgi:hypothetical protein
MRRAIFLAGVLPFVSAFFGGVLAFGLMAPSMAAAQPPAQEVRATSFTLVDETGAVHARLGFTPVGAAVLQFMRSTGTVSSSLSVVGLQMYDSDGSLYMRVGRCTGIAGTCPGGLPPFEGVQLGPTGSVSPLP